MSTMEYQNGSSVTSEWPKGRKRDCDKARLLDYNETPFFMRANPYIKTGYRGYFDAEHCVKSWFTWTNETLNIWTHLAGLVLFVYHLYDNYDHGNPALVTNTQRVIAYIQLSSYSITMVGSVLYHTFCCLSYHTYLRCLRMDLVGVIVGSTGNFVSCCFYVFECHPGWRNFYMVTSTLAGLCLFVSILRSVRTDHPDVEKTRMTYFVLWTSSPLFFPAHLWYLNNYQWTSHMGLVVYRLMVFYTFAGVALTFFRSYIPERLCPGSVDYVGHSHQWWHIFMVATLYWWYLSGVVFAQHSNEQLNCTL